MKIESKKNKNNKSKKRGNITSLKSSSIFEKNLLALKQVNELLFERICYPVGDNHTRFDENGNILYRVNRYWHQLEPSISEAGNQAEEIDKPDHILLFGIGHGVQLEDILGRFPDVPIVAWERDPWLLRLLLQRIDLSVEIKKSHLRFLLGADLIDLVSRLDHYYIVQHSFLASIYRHELNFLKNAPHEHVVLLRDGTLFVDDMADAFTENNFGVYTVDTQQLSKEELLYTVKKLEAEALVSINYQNQSAEFCHKAGIQLICWEVDPSTEHIRPPQTPTDHTTIFSYRQSNVSEFRLAGFENVRYLPLASDVRKRKPVMIPPEEHQRYCSPVSFVGASMVKNASLLQQKFLQIYGKWCGENQDLFDEGKRKLDLVLKEQRKDYSIYLIPELLQKYFYSFLRDIKKTIPEINLEFMVAESSAAEKRLHYLAKLTPFGVKVWGDAEWERLTDYGVKYAGQYAKHRSELNKIYGGSTINIDIGRIYQSDIVTMRVFDVLACGGFLIAEYNDALYELFELDSEIVAYRTMDELYDKVAYYLTHPDEIASIAKKGREAVLQHHTISKRFEQILEHSGLLKSKLQLDEVLEN